MAPHYYMVTYCRNFAMALPVQLLIAGPAARALFRTLFRRTNRGSESRVEQELQQSGFAE